MTSFSKITDEKGGFVLVQHN